MKTRWLSFGLVASFSTLAVACGETPPPDVAPQPAAVVPHAVEAPSAVPGVSAAPAASAAPSAAPSASADAKPVEKKEEKIDYIKLFDGKWAQDYSGSIKDADDAKAEKAGGPKKDDKKIDAAKQKSAASFEKAKMTFENAGGVHSATKAGKAAHKFKYAAEAKDGSKDLTVKATEKDQVSKKDLKDAFVFTFVDSDTVTMKDPGDKKGATVLVFKRQK
jgi:hypothetical protein